MIARAELEALAYRVWDGRTAGARMLRAALAPAAAAYGAVTAFRNRLYDAAWLAAARVPARVVSVGNLSVGGSGKTPTALWLAERLAARGRRTAIIARGYGKRRRGVVVVGEAGRALVSPDDGGDEAVMLAQRFVGPVVTGERRADAAALACARFGVDTIVLDDGFQHRALARDADLVLATDDAASSRVLPAGPLRETSAALARARAVLGVDGPPPRVPGVPAFRATLRPTAVVRVTAAGWFAGPLDALAGQRLLAVAGVARPERFVATVQTLAPASVEVLVFPDHHPYSARDGDRIGAAAAGRIVVTTEKDLAKLARFPTLAGLCAVRVDLVVQDAETLVDLLLC